MYEIGLLADAPQLHVLAAEIASGIDSSVSGAVAVEALAEVLSAGRQVDLATSKLIERADRTGEYTTNGAATSSAAWETGQLGLDHAAVIHQATHTFDEPDLIAALEDYLAPLPP